MARVCAEPGCPELAVDRTHCDKHKRPPRPFPRQRDPKAARAYDKKRGNRHQRGYDSKWDKAKREYLAAHRDCVECGKPATDVDHITPWKQGDHKDWKLFWDRDNWQALCHPHHSAKTYRETLGRRRVGRGSGGKS